MTLHTSNNPSSGPPKTVGLPRMAMEKGEKRVFLPDFVQKLAKMGVVVYLEEGYGSRGGYSFDDFRQDSLLIHQCSRADAFAQDLVLLLRSPHRQEFDIIPPGVTLVSMLHYPTRPWRVARLQELGIKAISLDSIMNDEGVRLIENMKAVAWNGLEAAFDVLEDQLPGLRREDGQPLHVLILGTGLVGKYAVDAAAKLGNLERYTAYLERNEAGGLALSVGRGITRNPKIMESLLRETDILVDATARRQTSEAVIPNDWLAWLPLHAAIVDLAVDPYLPDDDPPVVRGIEGIPQGNLNQFVFKPDDPNWGRTIPTGVPTDQRRTTVSCYSWPGIHADACMTHYGRQLMPMMRVLLKKGYDGLSLEGEYFERALARATLSHWFSLFLINS
jgi:alanine dehydrogenase